MEPGVRAGTERPKGERWSIRIDTLIERLAVVLQSFTEDGEARCATKRSARRNPGVHSLREQVVPYFRSHAVAPLVIWAYVVLTFKC